MHEYKKISYNFVLLILFLIYLVAPLKASANNFSKNYTIEIKAEGIPKTILKEWQKELETRAVISKEELNYFNYYFQQNQLALKKLLEAEGYYQATIKANYDEIKRHSSYVIDPGKQYIFGQIGISINGTSIEDSKKLSINVPALKTLKAKVNGKAQTLKVIEDVLNIEKWVEKNNCLFKYNISYKATINHSSHSIDIIYQVTYTNKATYGDIKFSGLKTIDELYLSSLIPIKKGECFQNSSLNDAKLKLRKSNLLDKIEINLPKSPNPDGSVPVNFVVTEKAPRTIKLGIEYSTDIGAGVSTGWEHRNILSHGEKLSTKISFAKIEKKLDVDLEKPSFIRSDQKLKISSSVKKEDSEAYESKGIDLSGTVERYLSNNWIAGVGTKYAFEHIIDQDNDEKTLLLSTPLFVSQDKRDDIFDPKKGWTLYLNATPAFDTMDVGTSFVKNSINGSYYKAISESRDTVLALRANLGSIVGASSNTIPATERFYGGGSESVRGYGYQLASPLDNENKPIGGRSLFASSAEVRFHITENYGLVPFVDCGKSFVNTFPGAEDSLLCGAGMGLRYYTLFGPLRIDVAAPLHKRVGVDDPFQIYFSIGQAF